MRSKGEGLGFGVFELNLKFYVSREFFFILVVGIVLGWLGLRRIVFS